MAPLSKASPVASLLFAACFALSGGCRRTPSSDESAQGTGLLAAPASPAPSAAPQAAQEERVRTLLQWPETAYHTSLALEGDTLVLLTATQLIRLTEGEPPAHQALPLGAGAAFAGDSVVYWDKGALWSVAKSGSEPKRLGPLPQPPQRLLGSERGVAWIERTPSGGSVVRRLQGDAAQVLYEAEEEVVAATMREDRLYFVEGNTATGWRLTGVSLDGKRLSPTPKRAGRTPAQLAAGDNGIYFYDGPTRSVRRVNHKLEGETTLAEETICSPLTLSISVFCAQVGGLYEVPLDGRPAKPLTLETGGPVTTLVADEKRVAWVVDVAADKLAVRSIALH